MTPAERSALFCIYGHNAWGGIESWLKEMLRAFGEAGWDVTLAVARGKRHNDVGGFVRRFEASGVEEIDGRTGTHEGRIAATLAVLRRRRPGVVIPLGLAHVARAVAREKLNGVPIRMVFPLHALSPEMLTEAVALDGVTDLCVAVNPLQERLLREAGYKGRLRTIENGAPLLSPEPGARERQAEPICLLFVGRFEQATKRVTDAIDLAAELRRRGVAFRYLLAGDGPARTLVEDRIRDEGLEGSFEVHGFVERERLLGEIMPAAHVLTLFSSTEAGPLVPLEGMSRGVVPLIAAFPGLKELSWFKKGETAQSFRCGEVAEAADVVARLAVDRASLNLMSGAARRMAEGRSWSRCCDTWIGAVEETFDQPVASARAGHARLTEAPEAGRLERAGLSPRVADVVRRTLRRYPDFSDGWAEWPGTLTDLDPRVREGFRVALSRETA